MAYGMIPQTFKNRLLHSKRLLDP